jgi:hypothetical protein
MGFSVLSRRAGVAAKARIVGGIQTLKRSAVLNADTTSRGKAIYRRRSTSRREANAEARREKVNGQSQGSAQTFPSSK